MKKKRKISPKRRAAQTAVPTRKTGRTFLFRVPPGEDLYNALTDFCIKKKIRVGTVSAIGALGSATIGYYDQVKKVYHKKTLKQELEIVACLGNISLKEGKPFLHLHITVTDTKLRALGGHLFPGSEIFAAEACIQEIKGKALERRLNAALGLPLWNCGD